MARKGYRILRKWWNIKKIDKINIPLIITIVIIFIILDWIIHYLGILPNLNLLPQGYFSGKLITSILGLIVLTSYFKIKDIFITSSILAVILQIRYFFGNYYDIPFNLSMIIIHFILLLISFYIFDTKFFKKITKKF